MQDNPPCCARGTACGGGAREGIVQPACLSLAPLSNEFSSETGSFCHLGKPLQYSTVSSQSQFPVQPALPTWSTTSLPVFTSMVVLADFFFNFLIVGVPCRLIFWYFWLFIGFRMLLSSLWLCEEVKVFYLCLHLCQNSYYF